MSIDTVATSASGRLIEYQGKPAEPLKKAFGKAVLAADLPTDVTPCSLRHTVARERRRRGVGSWELVEMMGHRQEATTEIYAGTDPTSALRQPRPLNFTSADTDVDGRLSICTSPSGQRTINVQVSR